MMLMPGPGEQCGGIPYAPFFQDISEIGPLPVHGGRMRGAHFLLSLKKFPGIKFSHFGIHFPKHLLLACARKTVRTEVV
jgi:hypothetical protein